MTFSGVSLRKRQPRPRQKSQSRKRKGAWRGTWPLPSHGLHGSMKSSGDTRFNMADDIAYAVWASLVVFKARGLAYSVARVRFCCLTSRELRAASTAVCAGRACLGIWLLSSNGTGSCQEPCQQQGDATHSSRCYVGQVVQFVIFYLIDHA
jgi:hypothetical protein